MNTCIDTDINSRIILFNVFTECAIPAQGGYQAGHSYLPVTEESHQDVQTLAGSESLLPENHAQSADLVFVRNNQLHQRTDLSPLSVIFDWCKLFSVFYCYRLLLGCYNNIFVGIKTTHKV